MTGKPIRRRPFAATLTIALGCVVLFTAVLQLAVFGTMQALKEAVITRDGEPISSLLLEENEKIVVGVSAQESVEGFRWQILDSTDDARWIDISDVHTPELSLTYALVGSMLRPDGTTAIRCKLTAENGEQIFTPQVDVRISYRVDDDANSEDALPENTFAQPMLYAMRETEYTTCSIVINYLFDNNTIAFEPYGASVATGSDFTASITSPTVMGYLPFYRVGENYVDATVVELDLKNVQQDVVIDVIYEPTLVDFSIHHHLQNLHNDEYSVQPDRITSSKAITGTIVGDGLALTEAQLPGFKALVYERLPAAADGSTVIEIRYDRNYYLVDFDMAGGYGTDPVYARYGTTIGANIPIRHGYVFDGWELVSYGGQTPTDEQKSMYEISNVKTILLPDANLRYRARWITQNTEYTMVFWKENADDNGYSYWGYLDGLTAPSGSYVDGRDYVSRVAGIDDEAYFTFNSERSDKNVFVEGDGSTVVNVYYTRNYYKLTFKAEALCTITTDHTHSDDCYDTICGKGHVHSDACSPVLKCTEEEHTAHTDDCLITPHEEHIHGQINCTCTVTEHTHTKSCWNNVGNAQSSVSGSPPSDPEDGEVYRYRSFWGTSTYYIYIKGTWYRYDSQGAPSGSVVDPVCGYDEHTHGVGCNCDKTNHTHTESCYKDAIHVHGEDCYNYSCGDQTHSHADACYRLICGIPEGHTHNSQCKSTRYSNTIKIVYRKYQQSLDDIWPITADNSTTTYDSGERWKPTGSSQLTQVLVYIPRMLPENFTLTLDDASYTPYVMNYWLQVLPGEAYTRQYNGKNYVLMRTIKASYNYVTKAEDFFDIAGYVQSDSDPAFTNNQISSNSDKTVDFYYDRNVDNIVQFSSNGNVLLDKNVTGVPYGMSLTQYEFEPDYPDNLEPNAYAFAGWYTSPGCFAGTEVDWENLTMSDGDMMLYAKWAPITHTVKVFKDVSLTEQIGQTQIVDHKSFAQAPSQTVTNGDYVFQGWFYVDRNGEEKAFTFTGIPILNDMNIYAKWSSHVPVDYTIYYKLKDTDVQIAPPTVGSTIAGNNKTFDAKAGSELYSAYQVGYYPLTSSHTLAMSIDGVREFTFYYVFAESMPYIVEYVDADTGDKLLPDKVVSENNFSVVTETFVKLPGKMPDAYQKRLVLSAPDAEGGNVLEKNRITFYYTSDAEHTYYRIVHYIQNISGDSYREYRSEDLVGVIGESYTAGAISIAGFTFAGEKSTINGVPTPASGNTVSGTLGSEGMLIELYYDRISVDYRVRYIDNATGDPIISDKLGEELFGAQVLEYAPDLTEYGYTLSSDEMKMLTVSANESLNEIVFYYQESNVAIKYEIVGPAGCGTLSQLSENVPAITGMPNGSYPIASKGFAFEGWYIDPACTQPVAAELVNAETFLLKPAKDGAIWKNSVYYAKFVSLTSNLTIHTASAEASDEQTFLFRITGTPGTDTEAVNLTVAILGNGTVTIAELPIGTYTVTELTAWSWRYDSFTPNCTITLSHNERDNVLYFYHDRTGENWLDGNAANTNLFDE